VWLQRVCYSSCTNDFLFCFFCSVIYRIILVDGKSTVARNATLNASVVLYVRKIVTLSVSTLACLASETDEHNFYI